MNSSDSCAGRNSTALNRPYHGVFSRLEDGKRFGLSARSLRGRKVRSESVGRRLAGGPEMGRREPGAPERTIPEPPAGNDWTGRKVQTAVAAVTELAPLRLLLQFGHSVPFHHDLPVALEWSVRVPRLGAASTRVPRPGADPHFRFGLSVLASCGRKVRSVCRPPNGSTLVRVISTAPTRQSGTILWAAFQQH